MVAYAPVQLSPVFTFAAYLIVARINGTVLDTTRVFTSISLLTILNNPLQAILQSIPGLASAIGCINRIQTHLETETRSDHRLEMPSSTRISTSQSDPAMKSGDIELEQMHPKAFESIPSININTSDAISIYDGNFGWQENGAPVLTGISLRIPRGRLTMLVGPVNSGKTTLLKVFLGETPSFKGFVYVSQLEMSFCDQTPWLINDSVQKNIIGHNELDVDWYNSVVSACVIDEDLKNFPQGDQTIVGSNGISLSGGQKSRVVCISIALPYPTRNSLSFPTTISIILKLPNN